MLESCLLSIGCSSLVPAASQPGECHWQPGAVIRTFVGQCASLAWEAGPGRLSVESMKMKMTTSPGRIKHGTRLPDKSNVVRAKLVTLPIIYAAASLDAVMRTVKEIVLTDLKNRQEFEPDKGDILNNYKAGVIS